MMNEVNGQQLLFNNILPEVCKYHFDFDTQRLGMICRNSINFEYKGIGKTLEQDRARADQTVAQTNVYRFTLIDNRIFEAENYYVVPDISSENLKKISAHFNEQGRTSKMYVCGGDFNVDWKSKMQKKRLNITSLSQMITEPTRVQDFERNGRLYKSSKIIDLVFANAQIKPKIIKTGVLNTSELIFFDHYGVTVELGFPKPKPFRDILVPRDPLRRPDIDDITYQKIEADINSITFRHDYDSYMCEVRRVLDMHIPLNPTDGVYVKRIYDIPYPKAIRAEIKLKHRLSFDARKNKNDQFLAELARVQRNRVKKLTREFKTVYTSGRLVNQTNPHALEKSIQFLQKRESPVITDPEPVIVNGYHGKGLVNDLSNYFKGRAEDLVDTAAIIKSPELVGAIKIDEIPETTLVLHNYPRIDDITKVIPEKKLTKTSGMDGISSKTLVRIWPIVQDSLNQIFQSSLKFPEYCQGYYQRVISKSSTTKPKIQSDMRPLGINNPLPKYHMSKYVFTELRKHISGILKKRNIMTYQGCTITIIIALDDAITQVNAGFFVIIQKFDFSNAYGTLYLARLLAIMSQLNVCENTYAFVRDYFTNQAMCQTVCYDGVHGIYISDPAIMSKGGPQGMVGMDVAFTVQQFGLSPLDEIGRSIYMDDINDIIRRCLSILEAIRKAKENDEHLTKQATQIGLAKNVKKTTYIPVNFPKKHLIDAGIDKKYVLTKTGILGFNFSCENKKISVVPAGNDIVCSIHAQIGTVFASQDYVADHLDRCKIARRIAYACLGKLSLVYAYGFKQTRNEAFEKVQVAINNLFRATGLRQNTPVQVLDKCFGTSLTDFATHRVLLDGFKLIDHYNLDRTEIFGRFNKIRLANNVFSEKDTFMAFFAMKFNNLDQDLRTKLINFNGILPMKNHLKSLRKLEYDHTIHENYYWISLRNDQ